MGARPAYCDHLEKCAVLTFLAWALLILAWLFCGCEIQTVFPGHFEFSKRRRLNWFNVATAITGSVELCCLLSLKVGISSAHSCVVKPQSNEH